MSERMIKITLTKSMIATSPNQRDSLRGLGLTRTGRSVIVKDTPTMRGLLRKVAHLVTTEE
ncbi:MAG: 50S ribosomal protein L30 [bacterium]|nr:50S ribosomal protein L30 [bacterium]